MRNRTLIWEAYDPTWLVRLTDQRPDLPWLADAFAACTTAAIRSEFSTYFVDPAHANRPGATWQFVTNVTLVDAVEGNLIVDVLTEHRIGGIEFYERLFEHDVE